MSGYDGFVVTVETRFGFETRVFRDVAACDQWCKANSRVGGWRPRVQGFTWADGVTL